MTTVPSDNTIPSPNANGLSGELARKISAKLIEILEGQIGEGDVLDTIKPLVPAVVEYGLREGVDAAEELLIGLGRKDPYPYWQKLIEVADPETRVELMEETRQAAIRDKIKQIERDELRWKTLKIALQVAIGVLGLLLV